MGSGRRQDRAGGLVSTLIGRIRRGLFGYTLATRPRSRPHSIKRFTRVPAPKALRMDQFAYRGGGNRPLPPPNISAGRDSCLSGDRSSFELAQGDDSSAIRTAAVMSGQRIIARGIDDVIVGEIFHNAMLESVCAAGGHCSGATRFEIAPRRSG
jgi:hypothetical protein